MEGGYGEEVASCDHSLEGSMKKIKCVKEPDGSSKRLDVRVSEWVGGFNK